MIIIDDEKKIEITYDHYKETIQYLKEDLKKRNQVLLVLLLLICVYFIIELKTGDAISVANQWIKNNIGISYDLNYNLLIIANLLFIFGSELRYFQLCVYMEKQYVYIAQIEKLINSLINQEIITREGFYYLKEYPLLSAFIHRIYNHILPMGIIITFLYKLQQIICFFNKESIIFNLLCIVFIFMICICAFLYLLFVNRDGKITKVVNKFVKKIFIFLHLYKEDDYDNNNDNDDINNTEN